MSHRVFIALRFSDLFKKDLEDILPRFKNILESQVKWAKIDHMHLTLHFFPEAKPAQVEELKKILGKCAFETAAFSLGFKDWGCFPDTRKPRVLWLGLNGDLDRLSDLHRKIAIELTAAGLPADERDFKPHLTLGRFKSCDVPLDRFQEKIGRIDSDLKMISSIELIESHLASTGSHYETLAASSFR